jgi:hypothetical protein
MASRRLYGKSRGIYYKRCIRKQRMNGLCAKHLRIWSALEAERLKRDSNSNPAASLGNSS